MGQDERLRPELGDDLSAFAGGERGMGGVELSWCGAWEFVGVVGGNSGMGRDGVGRVWVGVGGGCCKTGC